MTISMEIEEDSVTSISSEISMPESQKTPEMENYRTVEIKPEMLDRKIQLELQEVILSPEVMSESLKYWPGINVMGGGSNPMLLAGRDTVLETIKKDKKVLDRYLEAQGVNNMENPEETIKTLVDEAKAKEQKIREKEREVIGEINANRIRLHFDETLTHLSTIEALFDEDGNIKESEKDSDLYRDYMQLVEYVRELEQSGIKVEIALGPGVSHPERESEYEEKKRKRYMYSVTEYELPVAEDDKKVWERYCKGIARNFPNADLTVWIEPNYEAFVHSGRDPKKYAETVVSAANAVRTTNAERRVGINMLFVDQPFAVGALDHIKALDLEPKDVIGYVTFNPYRFQSPERPTISKGTNDKVKGDSEGLKNVDTYEQEIMSFYRKLSEYGINDIRVGESGHEGDNGLKETEKDYYKYSPEQNASCNIRSWVLNRYLWVRETPWRAIQKEGSKSNRGLVSEEGVPTGNYNAYRHFNEIFTPDVVPVGEITDPVDRRVYCKIFKNKLTGEDIVALWVAQAYDPREKIFQRRFTINAPSGTKVRQVSDISAEIPREISVDSSVLKDEGVTVWGDPVFLIGNLGYPE